MKTSTSLLLLILLGIGPGSLAVTNSSTEHKLRSFLLKDHLKDVRPVLDASDSVDVSFGMRLSQLVRVNGKQQTITTVVWVAQMWIDPHLRWDPSLFGGISTLHVAPTDIWVPDTVLYNNADESTPLAGYLTKFQTKVTVESNGLCIWFSPATFVSNCAINVKNWPFDNQICMMTFGSWSYGKDFIEYSVLNEKEIKTDLSADFLTNGDWEIKNITSLINTGRFSCCPEIFSDISIKITLERKPLYQILHLLVPVFILAALTLANFAIPVESGERIGYMITIFLAMSVYLLLLSDSLPETSEVVPLLEIFVIIVLLTVFFSLLATILVLVCYYKSGTPPIWLQKFSKKSCCKKSSQQLAKVEPQKKENDMEMQPDENVPVVSDIEWVKDVCVSWQDVSRGLDSTFFIVSFLIPFASLIALMIQISAIAE